MELSSLDRFRTVARDLLAKLYPSEDAETLAGLAVEIARVRRCGRSQQAYDQGTSVLITYGGSIRDGAEAPLQTLRTFLETRAAGAFSDVHVLPFFPSSSDGGFAVRDYRQVDEELGSWSDVAALSERFGLGVDLVLNHASAQGTWFRSFLQGEAPQRDWFFCPEPEFDARQVVRPRQSPLLTRFDGPDGACEVWTTFGPDQVDLDFRSSSLLLEMLDIVGLYFENGARILRLDAVAFLWKQSGSRCLHLPQTHRVVRLIRAFVEAIHPGGLVLTETNVPHDENVTYFGEGDEAHLVYQFTLPPLLLHAIDTGRVEYLYRWLERLEAPPEGCTYLNFTASHDGIGLRPFENQIPELWVDRLLARMRSRGALVSYRSAGSGREAAYELNCSYLEACRGWADDDLIAERRFLLTQVFSLTLRGIPAVYVHSLLGTGNDLAALEAGGEPREINRSVLELSQLEAELADPGSRRHRILNEMLRWLRRRRRIEAFHPDSEQSVWQWEGRVLGVLRGAQRGAPRPVLALFNFSGTSAWVPIARLPGGRTKWRILEATDCEATKNERFRLGPHGHAWLTPIDER